MVCSATRTVRLRLCPAIDRVPAYSPLPFALALATLYLSTHAVTQLSDAIVDDGR